MNENNFKVDFIGVGAPKSGTTWIAKCLEEHPQVCLSRPKEVNFFNKENFFYIKNQVLGNVWNYEKGIDWYKSHFRHCATGSVKGEFSTIYFYDQNTPELIYKNYPQAKIIMVLRNPADLFYSHYNHASSQWKLPPLSEAIKDKNSFIQYGFYSRFIERYFNIFSRNQILILIYEDIERDPLEFLKKIFRFLNVDENFMPSRLNKVVNPTAPQTAMEVRIFFKIRNFFISLFGKLIKKNRIIYQLVFNIDKYIRHKIMPVILKMGERKKTYKRMPIEIRERLFKIYAPEIDRLEKLINRDLSRWKD